MKSTYLLLTTTLILALGLANCAESKTAKRSWHAPDSARAKVNPIPYNVESVTKGKILFDKHCQICHGYWGEGNGVVGLQLNKRPANLLRIAGKKAEGEFAWKIAEGRDPMPGFRDRLSEDDIWNIVNFIESLENEQSAPVPLVQN